MAVAKGDAAQLGEHGRKDAMAVGSVYSAAAFATPG